MSGSIAGAASFQTRITTLTANENVSDEAGYLVATAVAEVAAELKVELDADRRAVVAAQAKLDSFSIGERAAGAAKALLGQTTPARAAAQALDAARAEVAEDEQALRRAEAKIDWFSDLSGNKARGAEGQLTEAQARRAQLAADARLRSECVAGTAESGCSRVAPESANNRNW